MIISRTPLRISFFGGGTDYPAYFQRHGGATLSATINKYTFVTVSPLAKLFEHSIGLHYSKVERVADPEQLQHPAVRECLRHLGIAGGVEIHIASDLPARSGLGSSSSFTVGLLNALHAFLGDAPREPEALAAEAVFVEQELIRERVGCQDQYACALGGLRRQEFARDGAVRSATVKVPPARLRALEQRLLLFYTGIQRYAHDILQEQLVKTANGELDARLETMKAMVAEGLDILLRRQRKLDDFGALLAEAWCQKAGLSAAISNPLIDEQYAAARRVGALGGKLLGAGGGGFLLLYVPPERQAAVERQLAPLHRVPFNFESRGSEIIFSTAG